MNKIKNIIFSNKKRTILTIFALVIVSFGIGYMVLAADDPYADKVKIASTSVSIVDGTPNSTEKDADGNVIKENWDADDSAGNDSSGNNKIVRNFDTITYNVSFTLDEKNSSDAIPDTATREVDIHIYIPNDYDVALSASLSDSPEGISKVENDSEPIEGYTHYIFSRNNITMTSPLSNNITPIQVTLHNGKNGNTFLPIIKVKESSDSTALSSVSNVLNETNNVITISAVEKYAVKLYPGTTKKTDLLGRENTTIPVGILLYLPKDSEKGIKGIQVPESVSFDMNIEYVLGSGNINGKGNATILDYDTSDEDREYNVPYLPSSYTGTNNGTVNKEKINDSGLGESVIQKFEYTDIKYNTGIVNLNEGKDYLEENNVIYLSSKVYAINVIKAENVDTKIKFSVGSESIEIKDNFIPTVGEYLSKIDFINESSLTSVDSEPTKIETPGKAMYNYNESFFIQNTISYAESSEIGGDVLPYGITNYVKIDNEAIKLINMENDENYYINITSSYEGQNKETTGDDIPFTMQYGVGSWAQENFKIKTGAPSYCPTAVPSSKEELMNLYGGPCIEENTDSISWVDEISEENENNVILLKFNFTDRYYPSTTTTIRLKAQVLSNISNIGKTAQVVSRGTTYFNDSLYYLSEVPNKSVSIQESDLSYKKSEYDIAQRKYTSDDTPTGKYGNTILITSFKTGIVSTIKDSNDSEKNNGEIYSGITDPISIEIHPSIYKSDFDATFTSATITVYLPLELELEIEKNDKTPESLTPTQEIIEDKIYNKYVYKYDEDDIKYGEQISGIDTLILHAYIDISTKDNTDVKIISTMDAVIKSNKDDAQEYSSYIPDEYRKNELFFTIRNTKIIGTIGKVSPSIFEKNGSFTYNMRAANSSGSTANLTLLKVLPFNGDGLGEGSEFDGSISIKLNEILPSGYQVYYTKASPNTIIGNELNSSSLNSWVTWTDYTSTMTGITAIKITAPSINNNEYFASKSGINITMTTAQSEEGNEYYNNFYILQDGVVYCDDELEGGCSSSTSGIVPYASNISYSSIYNRSISGYVFEDYNYDSLYSTEERRLQDIPIEIYKLANTEVTDKKDPLSVISENDELVGETTTDRNGSYRVKGLAQGNYYVKYTFDCEKYTVTEKNKQDQNLGDTSQMDSDASMIANTCTAVSNIITLDNNDTTEENIDLGLRIRKNFDVTIKKYITNVTVNSTKGTQSYDYENETKVKIDVKNLKNTSFRVTYKFVIENSKYFPGTIGQIVETIPEGMTFDSTLPENDGWYMSGDYLYYTKFAKTFILPDEKYYMTIVLDLKTDTGGEYLNIIAAQDLKIMDTTSNALQGIEIQGTDSNLDTIGNEE